MFLCWNVSYQRRTAFCARRLGQSFSDTIRPSSRQGTVIANSECSLGVAKSIAWLHPVSGRKTRQRRRLSTGDLLRGDCCNQHSLEPPLRKETCGLTVYERTSASAEILLGRDNPGHVEQPSNFHLRLPYIRRNLLRFGRSCVGLRGASRQPQSTRKQENVHSARIKLHCML